MAATSKQYELLFLLKAQIDSAFGTGFNTARNYLTDLQGKVKEYNSVLADISAYQKTEQKLNALNETIRQNGSATAAQQQKIQDYKNRLAELDEVLKRDGVDTGNLAQEQQRLTNELEATRKEMQDWVDLQNKVTDIANAFGAMKIVTDGVYNSIMEVNHAIADCVKGAGELQFTMSAVRGISGATEEETAQLTALAKEMGATTIYTAAQAAEALQTQALAGWSVQEMMAGLPAVVKLAAASGEDLTQMTSIISDSLAAFGLQGTDAVTKFADVLVKTATSSNTNVGLIGESLSYVESTAANLGYDIEDVGVALGVMANNALKGSVSGSALNTMLTRMSGANATAAKEMDRLGISMYYADGTAKDLMTFLNELRAAFAGFGDDAQVAQVSAYKLAGQRGMRGLLSIVNTSQEEWEQMTQDVYDYAGAAETISDIRLDNYQGQIYLLESAWDALQTTVGEAFLPVATDTAEILTDLCNIGNDFVGENQELVVSLSASATAFGLVAGAISAVGTATQALKFIMATVSPEMLAIFGGAAAVGAIAALVTGIAAYNAQIEYLSEEQQKLKETTDALIESSQASKDAYEEEINQIEDKRESVTALIDVLDQLTSSGKNDAVTQMQIADTVERLNELLPELNLKYDSLSGTISSTTGEMRNMVDTMVEEDTAEAKLARLQELEIRQQEILADIEKNNAAAAALEEEYPDVASMWTGAGADWADAVGNVENLTAEYEAAEAEIAQLKEELGDYADAQDNAADAIGQTAEALAAQEQALQNVEDAAQAYADVWEEVYEATYQSLMGQYDLFGEVAKIEEVSLSKMQENVEAQRKQAEDYRSNLETIFASGIDITPILDELTSGTTDAKALADEMAQAISSGNEQAVTDLVSEWQGLQDEVSATSDLVTDMYPEVQAAYDNLVNLIASFDDGELRSQAQAIGQGVIDGMVEGLEGDTSGVTSAGEKLGTDAIEAVAAGAGTHSPSTYTTETGLNIDQGLINGMVNMSGTVISTGTGIASETVSAFRNGLQYNTFYSITSNAMQGAINGVNAKKNALVSAFRSAANAAASAFNTGKLNASVSATGYASGTESATPGLHIVGENGPELAWFNGGEQVFDAGETKAILQAANTGSTPRIETPTTEHYTSSTQSAVIQLTYAPTITGGGGNEESIRKQLEDHDQALLERLNELLDEREREQARRSW